MRGFSNLVTPSTAAVPPVNVALPNVPVEINFLQQTIGADIGIDQDFTRDSLLQKNMFFLLQ